jgi:aerobic carbon-monoxide dehydrogenase small subunit
MAFGPVVVVLNGARTEMPVEPNQTVLELIRDDLGLTGAKLACGEGRCGSCTVLLDGESVNSCLVLAADLDGRALTTIEGLSDGAGLHPVQQAFVDANGLQCGYCTPGMILAAVALLGRDPDADERTIREELSGNICRCTGYVKIVESVLLAKSRMATSGATS